MIRPISLMTPVGRSCEHGLLVDRDVGGHSYVVYVACEGSSLLSTVTHGECLARRN
jgi:hypothetical protein